MASTPLQRSSSGAGVCVVAAWVSLAVTTVFALASVWGSAPESGRCDPITFTVLGAPPPFVRSELALAMGEIHDRSDLVFEEAPATSAKLSISWVVGEGPLRTSQLMVADHTNRRLGYGAGVWQGWPERRELIEGTLEVDGSLPWVLGIDRGDSLATTFVHELGHVIGLDHNADPASFMFAEASPRAPAWTASDEAHLARFSELSGCGRSLPLPARPS